MYDENLSTFGNFPY